jgi:hypothetical protein
VTDEVLNDKERDNLHKTSVVLTLAKEAKIIEKVSTGPKRIRGWKVLDYGMPVWYKLINEEHQQDE